jgi:hypothetical protein
VKAQLSGMIAGHATDINSSSCTPTSKTMLHEIQSPSSSARCTMVTMVDLYVVGFDVPGGVPLNERHSGQTEEPDEDLEPDVKTTFAHFGLSYYQASVLEHGIVNVLAVNRLVRARKDAERLLSDPWNDRFKETMGKLIKQLANLTQADPSLASDLVEALRLRNDLAHNFWRERAEDFCSDEGRAKMIAYLIEARNHFQDVDRRLTESIGTPSIQQSGLTAEHIESWYQDQLRKLESGESNIPLSTIQSNRDSLLSRLAPPSF